MSKSQTENDSWRQEGRKLREKYVNEDRHRNSMELSAACPINEYLKVSTNVSSCDVL